MKTIPSFMAPITLAGFLVSQPAVAAGTFAGKVAETMDASSYTYVLVDTGANKVWAAAAKFPVKVGDSVVVPESEPMINFHSKTLNRDFAEIYFVNSIKIGGDSAVAGKLPEGHPPIGGPAAGNLPAGHPEVSARKPAPKIDFTGFQPAKDGKTIEQIYASSEKLAGKSVKVRGKVVKYNADILGKNWLHIQDGTGSPVSSDILVTTSATVKVGDTVTVEGKVALNKDFGAGYKYALLIEEAKVTAD